MRMSNRICGGVFWVVLSRDRAMTRAKLNKRIQNILDALGCNFWAKVLGPLGQSAPIQLNVLRPYPSSTSLTRTFQIQNTSEQLVQYMKSRKICHSLNSLSLSPSCMRNGVYNEQGPHGIYTELCVREKVVVGAWAKLQMPTPKRTFFHSPTKNVQCL